MNLSAIHADADVMIRAGETEGHLGGSGSHLTFTTSHLTPFISSTPKVGRSVVRDAAKHLASVGVSVSVIERGVNVLDVGNVKPTVASRVFGLQNVRIRRPLRLLAAYVRS